MDWLGQGLAEALKNILSKIVIYVLLFILISLTFCLIAEHFLRNQRNKNNGVHDIDDKIERLKRNCMALKMIEAIYYNLNFRGSFKRMFREKYPDETSQGRLQQQIYVLEELTEKNMMITLNLDVHTTPMIRDLIEEDPPNEIEIEDAHAMLMVMKQGLRRTRTLSTKHLRPGYSIYPNPLLIRIQDIKNNLENYFHESAMILEMLDDNPENHEARLMNMVRKEKIRLVQSELRALECVMREKSMEYFASQLGNAQQAGD